MSGRRLCWPSMTVNWFTASQSFVSGSSKSISRTISAPMVSSLRRHSAADTLHQHPMKRPVVADERRMLRNGGLAKRFIQSVSRECGIESFQSGAKPACQNRFAKRRPLAARLIWREVWAENKSVAKFLKPSEGCALHVSFINAAHTSPVFGREPNQTWHRSGTSVGMGRNSSPSQGRKPGGQQACIRHNNRCCIGAPLLTRSTNTWI